MANCRGLNSCPCHFDPFEVHYTIIVQALSRYISHSSARVCKFPEPNLIAAGPFRAGTTYADDDSPAVNPQVSGSQAAAG